MDLAGRGEHRERLHVRSSSLPGVFHGLKKLLRRHFVNGSHKHAGFPVEKDIEATFAQARGGSGLGDTDISGCLPNFPEWEGLPIGYGEVPAGGGILLSGALCHSAGPNMSFGTRRAMAFVFMPEGALKDENHGAIPDELADRVPVGELLLDDEHLPLLWSRHKL